MPVSAHMIILRRADEQFSCLCSWVHVQDCNLLRVVSQLWVGFLPLQVIEVFEHWFRVRGLCKRGQRDKAHSQRDDLTLHVLLPWSNALLRSGSGSLTSAEIELVGRGKPD